MSESIGSPQKELIVIAGPTAAGKTGISLDIADYCQGEIISADSMQIYRGMDIGTAKISAAEMQEIPHHLLDFQDPCEDFSVADYQKLAEEKIAEIKSRGKVPMLVGGTGLYIKSVLQGFIFPQMEIDQDWRERKAAEAEERGSEKLHQELAEVDPLLAERIHPNDARRIIRGLEVYRLTGKRASAFHREARERGPKYHALKIGITRDREELYQRIEARVDRMFTAGLVKEVKELLDNGCREEMTSMQGLGYKEVLGYLEGDYSLEECKGLIKRNTRNYAKRQLTWFRRDQEIIWYNLSQLPYRDALERIKEDIARKFF